MGGFWLNYKRKWLGTCLANASLGYTWRGAARELTWELAAILG